MLRGLYVPFAVPPFLPSYGGCAIQWDWAVYSRDLIAPARLECPRMHIAISYNPRAIDRCDHPQSSTLFGCVCVRVGSVDKVRCRMCDTSVPAHAV